MSWLAEGVAAGVVGDTATLTLLAFLGALVLGQLGYSLVTDAAAALATGVACLAVAGSVVLAVSATAGLPFGVGSALGLSAAGAVVAARTADAGKERLGAALRAAALAAPYAATLSILVRAQDTRFPFSDVTAFMAGAGTFARGRADLLAAEPTAFYSFPPGAKVVHAVSFLYDPSGAAQVVYGGAGIRPLGLALLLAAAVITGSAVRLLLQDQAPRREAQAVAFLAGAALVTSGNVVSIAHLNGSHAPVAACLVLLALLLAQLAQGRPPTGRLPAACLLVAAVALHRWEAALVVPLFLLPAYTAGVDPKVLARLWQTLGATVALWSSAALLTFRGASVTIDWAGNPKRTLTAMAVFGATLFIAGTLSARLPEKWARIAPTLAATSAVSAVVLYGVAAWGELQKSLHATLVNLLPVQGPAAGGWRISGAAYLACGVALLVARFKGRRPEIVLFSYPALMFLPAMLLAAMLREGAYRVGATDSLNRSWLHILPLLLVAVATLAQKQRQRAPAAQREVKTN